MAGDQKVVVTAVVELLVAEGWDAEEVASQLVADTLVTLVRPEHNWDGKFVIARKVDIVDIASATP